MSVRIRPYEEKDLPALRGIWNEVVKEGLAFPQVEPLSPEQAAVFFAAQSHTGVAEDDGEVVGLYALHPNNVGRCGHIANAAYAVRMGHRGKRIGEQLVRDSLRVAAALSFRLMQFNAVVATNHGAIRLYTKLGFRQLGCIPGGFRLDDGTYADILLFYMEL